MKTVYFDTSALFKIFVEEEASGVAETIVGLAKDQKIKIVLSDWVINESIALVDKYRRKGKLDKIKIQQILSEIVDMLEGKIQYSHFTFYAVSEQIVIDSREIITDFHLSASDAIHVYIAQRVNCDCIVSADKDLISQVRNHTNANSLKGFNIRIENEVKELFNLLS